MFIISIIKYLFTILLVVWIVSAKGIVSSKTSNVWSSTDQRQSASDVALQSTAEKTMAR